MISLKKINFESLLIILSIHLLSIYGLIKYTSLENFIIGIASSYIFLLFGVVIGNHKYLSHKQFKCSRIVENIIITLSTLTFQGGPIFWATIHRLHHNSTEKKLDAHSASKGFFWSHIGWMLVKNPNGFKIEFARKYCKDLLKSKYAKFFERHSSLINLTIIIGSFALCKLFGLIDLFYWLFPIRIVICWHLTWLTNSYLHGAIPFSSKRKLKNSYIMAFTNMGEGFHKNHHDKPNQISPLGSLNRYDMSFLVLKTLERLGIIVIPDKNI